MIFFSIDLSYKVHVDNFVVSISVSLATKTCAILVSWICVVIPVVGKTHKIKIVCGQSERVSNDATAQRADSAHPRVRYNVYCDKFQELNLS